MDALIIARCLHVLGVVAWIGGVGMVTAVILRVAPINQRQVVAAQRVMAHYRAFIGGECMKLTRRDSVSSSQCAMTVLFELNFKQTESEPLENTPFWSVWRAWVQLGQAAAHRRNGENSSPFLHARSLLANVGNLS